MQNMAGMRQDTLPRWKSLLAELTEREQLLVEGLMQRVDSGARYYAGLVDADDFKASSVSAFRYLLGQLSQGQPPRDLAEVPHRIGFLRAGQGVPLESLVSTVREDFKVLWATLLRISQDTDMPVLVAHVDDLWRAVDDFAAEIQVSYLRESAARTEIDLTRQRAMISALFSSAELHRGLLRQVAGALGVPEVGAFEVVACSHADHAGLDTFVGESAAQGLPVYTSDLQDALIAFWHTPDPASGARAPGSPRSGERLARLRCGRAPNARALSEVPAKARTALHVLRALPDGRPGPRTMVEVWDRLASAHLRQVGPEFLGEALRRIEDCPAAERHRILETAQRFAENGSIAATADSLFCHRNTILNRLRRFRELTDLDLTVPRQAALALILLTRCAPPPPAP